MIEEPGSFSGKVSSPKPQRGPEARKRISFAIFIKETATVLSAPDISTMASCAANASNLFFADAKGDLPMRRIVRGVSRVYKGEKPVADLSEAAREYWILRGKEAEQQGGGE